MIFFPVTAHKQLLETDMIHALITLSFLHFANLKGNKKARKEIIMQYVPHASNYSRTPTKIKNELRAY